jgi:GDPmannose 4,6-dehydratase
MKTALITGVTGQDGATLAALLLANGDEVHQITFRAARFNTSRFHHIHQDPHPVNPRFFLHRIHPCRGTYVE